MPQFALPRRKLLMGGLAGLSLQVGLPTLESMLNANGTALAQGQALPKRLGVWFWGLGVLLNKWVPAQTGAGFVLSEQLMPLLNVKPYLNVVTGMDIKYSNAPHHTGGIAVRTGANRQGENEEASTVSAPSIDQLAVATLGSTTRFKSLEVGVLRKNAVNEGDGMAHISNNGPYSPNPQELDPAKVFDRLFTGFQPPGATPTPAPSDISLSLRKSVLDAVLEDMTALKPRLGASDIARLDQHAEHIRGIERRLVGAPVGGGGVGCRVPGAPTSYGTTEGVAAFTEVNRLMSDLVTTALACDLTRIFTFEYSGASSFDSYEALVGSTTDAHTLTHNNEMDRVNKIVIFIMQQLSYFLNALAATPEGSSNLLEQSGILCTSELAEGFSHEMADFPLVIAGHAGGALKSPGVHYRSTTAEPTSIPVLSLLRAVGLPLASFGEGPMQTSVGLSAIES